jgi:AcrR family transcriptional regulator
MRIRTDGKRCEILAAAAEVFREQGFSRTSMAEIAARVGGSKATLYGYFTSKEELFFAIVRSASEDHLKAAFSELETAAGELETGAGELEPALQRFGERMLATTTSPEFVASQRLVIAESGHTAIGRMFYESGPCIGKLALQHFLERAIAAGKMRPCNAVVATEHLVALLHAETMHRCLFNIEESFPRSELKAITARALAAFLAAYGAVPRAATATRVSARASPRRRAPARAQRSRA